MKLLEKAEFEPRIRDQGDRLASLEGEAGSREAEQDAARHLRLVMGRLRVGPEHTLEVLDPVAGRDDRNLICPAPAGQVGWPDRVRKYTPVSSIEMTYGCRFRCPYCPIPAYNQHKDRSKSPQRIADEMNTLHQEYGISYFFGSDDNFFNHKERTVEIIEELATTKFDDGTPLGKKCKWSSEVTVHDTLQMRDHLRRARDGGCRALWLGVENMTATFIKKGQSVDKTKEAFDLLRRNGIHPMPMLMHDDTQPLLSFKTARGLLNQIQLLRNAGAMSVQVLMLTAAPGSKIYDDFYRGIVFKSVDNRPVERHLIDGNHIVAYGFFYNPLRFLKALVFSKNRPGHLADAGDIHPLSERESRPGRSRPAGAYRPPRRRGGEGACGCVPLAPGPSAGLISFPFSKRRTILANSTAGHPAEPPATRAAGLQ